MRPVDPSADETRTNDALRAGPGARVVTEPIGEAPVAPPPGAEPVRPPSTARFTVRRALGAGGMGAVYEAFDEERRAAVALKVLSRFDAPALARFKREFRSLQGIVHPNLVALDELFFEDGQWFFSMELLDGSDFLGHVRGGPDSAHAFDEGRLRPALAQLLEGLATLHAAGKVHRDVKPSNVLVTREGRVVLLDFGLVSEVAPGSEAADSSTFGTPAYMAPEQAALREVGPAADLYAVGVVLYQTLTGVLPFVGDSREVLARKQASEPEDPRSIGRGVPADLGALCMDLLRVDPARRPSAAQALRSLASTTATTSSAPRAAADAPVFVGRNAELAELHAAWGEAAGGLSSVLVCGESGIGKTCLVRRFTTELAVLRPDAVVLEGRCYEREAVPYKTLDGVVDALTRRLARMPAEEVTALLPPRATVLAQVFPVMRVLPQLARGRAGGARRADPRTQRRQAFRALRELLGNVARRYPTVVVIDDLQWADDDGLIALGEVVRRPDAPPLLWIGTTRSRPGDAETGVDRIRAALEGVGRVLRLPSLAPGEARELAERLLGPGNAADGDAESIAADAGGHPLFVEELARHVADGGPARDDVKLDDVIWSRVERLDPGTRAIAEVVALAGKPLAQEVIAAGARSEHGDFHRRAMALRAANLVRTGGTRWADSIEPYHDRVREVVLARLEPAQQRAVHGAIGAALEATGAKDAEGLATHWRQAGDGARAAKYAGLAGDEACEAFAFDRASEWYRQAIELVEGAEERRGLRVKLGEALANAARRTYAAEQLTAAAEESPPALAADLRRRAARQHLLSGDVERGMAAGVDVLASTGLRMPKTRLGMMWTVSRYRLRFVLHAILNGRGGRTAPEEKHAVVHSGFCSPAARSVMRLFGGIAIVMRAILWALFVRDVMRSIAAVAPGPSHPAKTSDERDGLRAAVFLAHTVLLDEPEAQIELLMALATAVVSIDGRAGLIRGLSLVRHAETALVAPTSRNDVPSGARLDCAKARFLCFHFAGEYESAAEAAETAVALARLAGLRFLEAVHTHNAGEQYVLLGLFERAREALVSSNRLAADVGSRLVEMHNAVLLAYLDGRPDLLATLARDAGTAGSPLLKLNAHYWAGILLARTGAPEAREALEEARCIAHELKVRRMADDCERALAHLEIE